MWICCDGRRLDWSDQWRFEGSPYDTAIADAAIRLWAEGEISNLFLQSFPVICRDDNCNNRLTDSVAGGIVWEF